MIKTISDSFGNRYLCIEEEEDLNLCVNEDRYQCIGRIIDKKDIEGPYPLYFWSIGYNGYWHKISRKIFIDNIQREIRDMDEDIVKLHQFLDQIP